MDLWNNFTWYFFHISPSRILLSYFVPSWSKLFEIRHVSPIKLPQGRDRQSSSIQDLGWNQSHITRPSREVSLKKKQNIWLEWYLRTQHNKNWLNQTGTMSFKPFLRFITKFVRVVWIGRKGGGLVWPIPRFFSGFDKVFNRLILSDNGPTKVIDSPRKF